MGERLAHPRPSETSRHTFLRACRGSFPSISLSISSPDLVTGCSCPLPLADLSAWALALLCFIKSTRSGNPGQLCAQPRGRRRCGRRALLACGSLPSSPRDGCTEGGGSWASRSGLLSAEAGSDILRPAAGPWESVASSPGLKVLICETGLVLSAMGCHELEMR